MLLVAGAGLGGAAVGLAKSSRDVPAQFRPQQVVRLATRTSG
jgi:hypothetical protein